MNQFATAIRACAGAVALAAPSVFAQSPTATVVDTGPTPAEERDSVGAVLVESSPVLAQRAMVMQTVAARARMQQELAQSAGQPDTRALGGPPQPQRAAPKRQQAPATDLRSK